MFIERSPERAEEVLDDHLGIGIEFSNFAKGQEAVTIFSVNKNLSEAEAVKSAEGTVAKKIIETFNQADGIFCQEAQTFEVYGGAGPARRLILTTETSLDKKTKADVFDKAKKKVKKLAADLGLQIRD